MALLCCRARPQGACSRCGCLGSRQLAAGWRNGEPDCHQAKQLARSQGAIRIRQFAGTNSAARPIRLGVGSQPVGATACNGQQRDSTRRCSNSASQPSHSHHLTSILQPPRNNPSFAHLVSFLFKFYSCFLPLVCSCYSIVCFHLLSIRPMLRRQLQQEGN